MESIIGKLMHKLKTEHTCFKVATKINIQGFICQLQNFKLRNIFLKMSILTVSLFHVSKI